MGLHTENKLPAKASLSKRELWRKRVKDNKFAYMLMVPTIIFMMLVHLLPMLQGIWMSFLKLNQFTLVKYLKAPFVGMDNYIGLLFNTDNPVRQGLNFAIRNTAIYAVIVTIGVMIMGLMMAMLLNRDFPGRSIARTAMLLPGSFRLMLSACSGASCGSRTVLLTIFWSMFCTSSRRSPSGCWDRIPSGQSLSRPSGEAGRS